MVRVFLGGIVLCLLLASCQGQNPNLSGVSIGAAQAAPRPAGDAKWFHSDGTLNWEAEKAQTDTIVIHHTGDVGSDRVTWQKLSSIQYERLYVPRFKPGIPDPSIPEGTPVQSGHFREDGGKRTEVFYAYHWLVRPDGSSERLLKDGEVGWHSGNWKLNCQSVAICMEGDLSSTDPTPKALATVKKLVADYRKKFPRARVVAHKEVKSTACPGTWYNSSDFN